MTKSELIKRIYRKSNLPLESVSAAVNTIVAAMTDALGRGERIEIRDFGAFSLHLREARKGRNPRTGAPVDIPACYKAHFKPGKALRTRVNA